MKILVVDDSKAVHAFIKSVFKSTEHKLCNAYNGVEALESVDSEKPDLILLDWEMPVMDGIETLVELRAREIDTPVVMVTSRNEVSHIILALEKGANEYVMKPFTKEMLFEKLAMVVGKEVA